MTNLIACLDTETTGIGPQARVIQIAIDLCKPDGTSVATLKTIINQETPSHPRAIEVHGITDEMQATGMPKVNAGRLISELLSHADILIGHNIPFDIEMCSQSFNEMLISHKPIYCTMRRTTDYMRIPSPRGGHKWPKLIEVYRHMFGEDFDGAHDAWADMAACKRVYMRCLELGL